MKVTRAYIKNLLAKEYKGFLDLDDKVIEDFINDIFLKYKQGKISIKGLRKYIAKAIMRLIPEIKVYNKDILDYNNPFLNNKLDKYNYLNKILSIKEIYYLDLLISKRYSLIKYALKRELISYKEILKIIDYYLDLFNPRVDLIRLLSMEDIDDSFILLSMILNDKQLFKILLLLENKFIAIPKINDEIQKYNSRVIRKFKSNIINSLLEASVERITEAVIRKIESLECEDLQTLKEIRKSLNEFYKYLNNVMKAIENS